MSAKKSFALMHIEAMERGEAVGILFGYRVQMEYREKEIVVEIAGKRKSPSLAEIEKIVKTFLLFSAPVEREETSTKITLRSNRVDVFSISKSVGTEVPV